MLYNQKILDIIAVAVAPQTRVLALEGTVRSSKTASLTSQAFYLAVCQSKEKYHCIAGRNLDAIRKNILEAPEVGLLPNHPNVQMCRAKVGSYFLKFKYKGEVKEIALANYSNSSSWKNVLGGTLGCVLIDEADIADPDFIREIFSRQVSVDRPKLFFTSNGNTPTHTIYQEVYNYCKPLGKIPSSTMTEVVNFQKKNGSKCGWYYYHCTMEDNPVMTEEKINLAKNLYPVGSYYYKIKILGERGVPGKLLFEEYMTEDLIVNAREIDEKTGRKKFDICYFSIGCDIGATRATNSIRLIGWTKDFGTAIILERDTFKQCGYDEKKLIFLKFVQEKCIDLWNVTRFNFDGMAIDSAEQNFIVDMNSAMYKTFGLDAIPSYKATIKDRVDMDIIGFSQKRILFNSNCREDYEAFKSAVRSDKPNEIREDKNEKINDIMDAVEYGLTRHMKPLMRGGY